mgnify:CR=1 FL=1
MLFRSGAHRGDVGTHVDALADHGSAGGPQQSAQEVDAGGFARAVGAEQPEDLSRGDVEGEMVERDKGLTAAAPELHAQIAETDGGDVGAAWRSGVAASAHGCHETRRTRTISTVVNRRPGRPSQPSNTRARILEAARNRFEAEGYTRTSLRSIAREADVDHALVTYYFGSKEGLFRAVTRLALSPAQGFDTVAARVAPEYLAEALLRAALALWDRPEYRTGLVRLFTSALASESALRILREYLHSEVVKHLTDHIQGPNLTDRKSVV